MFSSKKKKRRRRRKCTFSESSHIMLERSYNIVNYTSPKLGIYKNKITLLLTFEKVKYKEHRGKKKRNNKGLIRIKCVKPRNYIKKSIRRKRTKNRKWRRKK